MVSRLTDRNKWQVASARHNSEDLFYLKSGLKNHLETKEDLPEDLPEELLKDMRKRRGRVIILLEDSCTDKFLYKREDGSKLPENSYQKNPCKIF